MKIDRTLRIAELIQRELANIIIHNLSTPLLQQMTIVGAKVAPDLSVAKIFISTFDKNNAKATIEELSSKTKILRHYLAKNLNLRVTPKLYFVYDTSAASGQELDMLIDKAIARDTAQTPPEEN